MNIENNPEIEIEHVKLTALFKSLAASVNEQFSDVKNSITHWEHSLGPTQEFIPYELIIPSISKQGKKLKTLTESNKKSKNLISYGFNQHNKLVIAIKNYGGDADRFGVNARFLQELDGETYILNAHLFEKSPDESKLISACKIHNRETHIQYISVTPPHDRYVRIDEIIDEKIVSTLTWATSWFKPLHYTLTYDNNNQLSKVMIDGRSHWSYIP